MNIDFFLYDKLSGVILQRVAGPESSIPLYEAESRAAMLGVADDHRQYVRLQDATLADYTEGELSAISSLQPGWVWKMPERQAVDLRSLDDAKTLAWARVKRARDIAEKADFVWDGATYQADAPRIAGATQLALLAQLAGAPYSIDWTLSDNTTKTLDAAGMIAVGAALGRHVAVVFETGRGLREQIAAATIIADVDAIVWPA